MRDMVGSAAQSQIASNIVFYWERDPEHANSSTPHHRSHRPERTCPPRAHMVNNGGLEEILGRSEKRAGAEGGNRGAGLRNVTYARSERISMRAIDRGADLKSSNSAISRMSAGLVPVNHSDIRGMVNLVSDEL